MNDIAKRQKTAKELWDAQRAAFEATAARMRNAPYFSPGESFVRRADVPETVSEPAPWAGEYFCPKDRAYLRLQDSADHREAERIGKAFVKEHRRCA